MKLLNHKKIAYLTGGMTLASTIANAAPQEVVSRSLGDWVSLVAEILSFVCLFVFIAYIGRYLSIKPGNEAGADSADTTKVVTGIKNGIMTGLVGIALCQAVIIVAQIVLIR